MPKKAVIDLGTNTFNLLIAEVYSAHFDVILKEKVGVGLGIGGINEGYIAPEAFERGLSCLVRYKELCRQHGVSEIRAIGTSAIRGASNQDNFIRTCFEKTGINIEVISGELEAQLIYNGVCWNQKLTEKSIIMDIGGGSTEFILADQHGVSEMRSFDIGVSRIFQSFNLQDPYSETNVIEVEDWLNKQSKNYFDELNYPVLIGASGSFETFYELIFKRSCDAVNELVELPLNELNSVLNELIRSAQIERDRNPYISEIRKKMAGIAAIKTRWVISNLGIERVWLSPYSLKEGALKD